MFNMDPQFVETKDAFPAYERGRNEGWVGRINGAYPQENPFLASTDPDSSHVGWNRGWELADQAIRRHAQAQIDAGIEDPLQGRPLINVAGEAVLTLRNMVVMLERQGKFSDALDLRRGLAIVEKVTKTIR